MLIGGPGLHREIPARGVREDLLYMVSMEGVTKTLVFFES